MQIQKITRCYSRSINVLALGAPNESWIRVEATYEAQLESQDDPKLISDKLNAMCQADVAQDVQKLTDLIKSQVAATKQP